MKTITINVEFELSDDMPAEVPMTTDEFANRIKSCFKQETSEKKRTMSKNINKIIQESDRNVLLEMDLVPTDGQGNANLVQKQAVNAWRMIYRLMDNVKTSMDATMQGKKIKIKRKSKVLN